MSAPLHTIEAIKRRHKGHWFDADTMRFFKTRILPDVYADKARERSLFITSEPYAWTGPRVYTLRSADWSTGDIATVGEMGEHATVSAARRALALEASTRSHA